jgi:uncharacterized protein YegP (UPF0339 family)
MYKFEIFRDSSGGYRWRLTASNGYVVATGDPRFRTSEMACRAVRSMRSKLAEADVQDTARAA